MLSVWVEITTYFENLFRPLFTSENNGEKRKWYKPRFNFIILHYIYLISLTLIASIILYPVKNLDYIDCLFFGSGSATQSGLNTVNLNELYLYQQITLYLMTMLATPIFINTFVVFVRLYWFEKRFQNVVIEAQKYRRTRERTRTMSEAKQDHDVSQEEKGVGNRHIIVVRPGTRTIMAAKGEDPDKYSEHHQESSSDATSSQTREGENESSSEHTGPPEEYEDAHEEETVDGHHVERVDEDTAESMGSPTALRRDITFADELQPAARENSDDRMPEERDADHHIAFVENQRNPKDQGTLYIPGPRDFDKGYRPQALEEIQTMGLQRQGTASDSPVVARKLSRYPESSGAASATGSSRRDSTDNPLKKKIRSKLSFEDPSSPLAKVGRNVLNRVKFPSEGDTRRNSNATEDMQNGTERDDATGEEPTSLRRRGRARTFQSIREALTNEREDGNPMPYLSYQPTIGRNSAFANLSEEQRDELGGIEYRALKTLAMTLCTYYIGLHLLGLVCLTPWITYTNRWGKVVDQDGINRPWWGIFTSASLFNDLGYTLTPDSMISFQYAVFPLLLGSWLIVIGNTGFPCWLRFQIWVASLFTPKKSSLWEEFRFLLDHPRRCFTLLFPARATWWLFWILVIMNGLDLLFFIVLDLNDPVLTRLPSGIRVLNGWFQAVSTRTAGFAVVNLADLHPAIQVSYLVMMYISVFPIAISVRRTNVYEEKSLGIWGNEQDDDPNSPNSSYVGAHLRRQLSFDLWYIFLGLFIICIVEGDRLRNTKDYAFTVFSVLFEIVSAYGTVGLSLGYPGTDTSFSAQFRTLSKLVVIAMQLRGRHRGLPYALDKAILLPSEEQRRKENEDATRRARTFNSAASFERHGSTSGPSYLPRSQTDRSVRSTQSAARRKTRLRGILLSGMSAGPSVGKLHDRYRD